MSISCRGEALHQNQCRQSHSRLGNQQPGKQLFYAGTLSRTHIKAHNGNAACCQANHNGDDDLKEFHHNSHHRHWNLGVLLLSEDGIHSAVFPQHVVHGGHGGYKTDLRKKAGYAQNQCFSAYLAGQSIVAAFWLDIFHLDQVGKRQIRGKHLPDDSGHRRAHHPPAESENENRVKNHIDQRTGQGGDHGKPGIPIRPNNGVHCLTKHIKGKPQSDVKKILAGVRKGLGIYRAAKQGDDPI